MISALYSDKKLVADILTQSFFYNKSVNYVIKDDRNKTQRIRSLMEYSFDMCFLYGRVLLSDDRKACALVLFPAKKKLSWKSVMLDLRLIFTSVGIKNISKTLNRETKIKNHHPKDPFFHLWFIGVDPLYQNQGIGSKLLNEVIAEADRQNMPIYLETSTIKNISWYRKFKFDVFDKIELGYTLLLLSNKS